MAAVATVTQPWEGTRAPSKRKLEHRKGRKPKDAKMKRPGDVRSHKKVKKLRELWKEDDSDVEEEEWAGAASSKDNEGDESDSRVEEVEGGEGEWERRQEERSSGSDTEEGGFAEELQKGVTKFTHGCRAFKVAFTKITQKSAQADPLLGPVLSAHKKLVVKKLAEEEEELKAKGEAKKERQLAAQRGHVKPATFLDSREKFLISVATKGVVKLFNAVNKAQHPQKSLNPSRSKDAKELAKRRKEAFLYEIKKSTTGANDNSSSFNPSKVPKSTDNNHEEPGWAPLRDSYMLTSSKLKDWDKMENPSTSTKPDTVHSESSSDE